VELRAWIVPTLALDPAAGAGLLLALGDGDRLTVYDEEGTERELPLDPSVAYAHAIAAFADALVSRGEIHPWLAYRPEDHGYFASWVPAYALESAAHRRALISAMPPAFRCQLLGTELTGQPAEEVFDHALTALVDAYVLAAFAGPHGLHGEPLAPPGARRRGLGATELWLRALTSTKSNRLDPDLLQPEEADELIDLLEAWTTAAEDEAGPVRTCFRLRDPGQQAHDVEDWTVELLLQSTQDPSLLAGAREVWQRTGAARVLRQTGVDPRQALLQGLGRAARYFPQLGDALRQPSPERVRLTSDQALNFLRHTAPALRERGFGVLLPPWWAGKRARISLNLHTEVHQAQPGAAEPAKDSKFGLEELVKYRWQASLGEIELTETEFMELAAAKTDLVQLRGEWVEVDAARLAAAAAALGVAQTGTMTAAEVLNKAMHGLDQRRLPRALTDDPLEVRVTSSGWLGDLLSGSVEQRYAVAKEPRGMKARLRPYQKRGVGWLTFMDGLGLGAILADDMGLGKTVQVLTLLEQERQEVGRRRVDPTLLICPMSLVANWQREAERFTPKLKVHVHHGSERLEGKEFQNTVKGVHMVVTTYALALRDREQLGEVSWRRIVIDEAQAIKNAATKQARAVRSLSAPRRIALTGTPVENRLADLWSIMEFANPGLLGTAEQFKDRFARPIERGNEGADAAAERLRQATGGVRAAPGQDGPEHHQRPAGQGRDAGRVQPDQRAGEPVPGRGGPDARGGPGVEGGDRQEGPRARRPDPAQADLRPPRALPQGRLPAAGPQREAGPRRRPLRRGAGGGREGAAVHPVRGVRRDAPAASVRALRPAGLLPARRHPAHHPRRPGPPLRAARRTAAVRALAQGGRCGTQPDGREPRAACGQVVEPGGGEPGHRPRVPHRPAEERAGQKVDVRGYAGGADRPGDRGEEGARGEDRRLRRELADGAVGDATAGPGPALRRRRGRVSVTHVAVRDVKRGG
jgi:hypothetical protein